MRKKGHYEHRRQGGGVYLYEQGDVNPPKIVKVWVPDEPDPNLDPRWRRFWDTVLPWRW